MHTHTHRPNENVKKIREQKRKAEEKNQKLCVFELLLLVTHQNNYMLCTHSDNFVQHAEHHLFLVANMHGINQIMTFQSGQMLYLPDVENRNLVKINPMKFFIQAKYFVHFECRSRHRRTGVEQRTVSKITLSWKAGEVVEHQKRRRISSMMLVCDGQS